jgi:HEAT repeat protein
MSESQNKTRGEIRADELMAQLRQDPEWLARQRADAETQRRRREQASNDSMALRAELAAMGVVVESVSDLYLRRLDYRAVIPVLVRWLPVIDNPAVKESVVRALTVRWAKPSAGPALVAEFVLTPDIYDRGLRWAIGSALAEVADDSVFDDIVAIAENPRWGRSREMVVEALGNMRDHRAIEVLRRLLSDKDVAANAIRALGRLRAGDAREDISAFLRDDRAWVRKAATQALQKIDPGGSEHA